MDKITFEEFNKTFAKTPIEELKDLAKNQGISVPNRVVRGELIQKLYESLDNTTTGSNPSDTTTPSILPLEEPVVDFIVRLKGFHPRWRGGRLWANGPNMISEKELTPELRKALERDKSFVITQAK